MRDCCKEVRYTRPKQPVRQTGAFPKLSEHDTSGAFLAAFQALEICYLAVARERGWNGGGSDPDRFGQILNFLARTKHAIREDERVLAEYLASSRNVVAHKFGFEPSEDECRRAISRVRGLCARFAITASDIMVKPVITVTSDQSISEILNYIIDEGISQFPVVEGGKIVGTILDRHVLSAYAANDGLLLLNTPVGKLMSPDCMTAIEPNASIHDVRNRLANDEFGALLVIANGLPTGIITKYDLLRQA